MLFVWHCPHMTDSTPTWRTRADNLGLRASVIARATGVSVSSVEKYRRGERRPSDVWLLKVDWLLTDMERAVERGGSAA